MHSIDAAYFCARLSVCMSVTTMSPAKTDEPIEMPFGKQTRVGPRNQVTDGAVHWRHLVNTIDRSVRRLRCGLSLLFL